MSDNPLIKSLEEVTQTPFGELLEGMNSFGAGKVVMSFSQGDTPPMAAVVLLRGEQVSDYLAALDRVDDEEETDGD